MYLCWSDPWQLYLFDDLRSIWIILCDLLYLQVKTNVYIFFVLDLIAINVTIFIRYSIILLLLNIVGMAFEFVITAQWVLLVLCVLWSVIIFIIFLFFFLLVKTILVYFSSTIIIVILIMIVIILVSKTLFMTFWVFVFGLCRIGSLLL